MKRRKCEPTPLRDLLIELVAALPVTEDGHPTARERAALLGELTGETLDAVDLTPLAWRVGRDGYGKGMRGNHAG